MLKHRIETLDVVEEPLRTLYAESDEGGFELQVEGLDALKRAKQHEKTRRQEVETRVRELENQLRDSEKRELDVKRTQEDLETRLRESQAAIGDYIVQAEASRIASELSGKDAHLIMPWIKERMRGQLKDGKATVTVLDVSGRDSEASLDELKAEFQVNESFSSILTGSRGSGSGANSRPGGSGFVKPAKQMTSEERRQMAKQDPTKFRQTFDLE